jgi:hypothetical protein
MLKFNSIQELLNYVPSCLVCGKNMEAHIYGHLSTTWSSRIDDRVFLRFEMKDGLLCSRRHNKHSIILDPSTNLVLEGTDTVSKLMTSWINFYTTCWTCNFKISTEYKPGNARRKDIFPALTLTSEELSYTLKRQRGVHIQQTYYEDNRNYPGESTSKSHNSRTWITVNNKVVKPMYVDFNKFKDVDQLNKRLFTIMTFS